MILLLLVFYSCQEQSEDVVQFIDVPTSSSSSEPSLLKTASGDVYLSWIETNQTSSRLMLSQLHEENNAWKSPIEIAEGSDWFVNWADFPSVADFGSNQLVAHYLKKSAPDTYAYDVMLSISNDQGQSWNDAFLAHKDSTHTEHGFVSKMALNDESFMTVWLDGRQNAYAKKDSTITEQMSLRAAIIDKEGQFFNEFEIDQRVCDCCQTDMAMTSEGPIVVYRDRSENETRDNYYSRFIDGSWTTPKALYNDQWIIEGCPVNGPAVSALNSTVAATWFTMSNNGLARVKMAFSENNGKTFNAPIALDVVNPQGRLDIELLDDTTALVSWMDMDEDKTVIYLQKITSDGTQSEKFAVSETSEERSSGFPRMVVHNDAIYMAWTQTGDPLNIRCVKIDASAIQ